MEASFNADIPTMAGQYKDELSGIIAGATRARYPQADLACKHFFSGAALYVNSRICISLTPAGLALKLSETDRTTLMKDHRARPLKYFANSPVKKDYVVLHEETVNDTRQLRRWIRRSIEYVLKR